MQILVFVIDVDHTVENHMPLRLRKRRLCVESAARGTTLGTKLADWSLTALGLARLFHCHRLQTLLYIHLVLLQEKLQISRAIKLKRPFGGMFAVTFDLG